MALSCGMKCLKYLLFAFNFVFWIAGVAVLGVGIYSRVQAKDYASIIGGGGLTAAANIMIAAGFFVMLIGFVGCCGALKENRFMLVAFFFLLFCVFVLEIGAGVLAYTHKAKTMKAISDNISKAVSTGYGGTTTSDKSFTKSIDFIQKKLKCCGISSSADWKNSTWIKTHAGKAVPVSCCINEKVTNCNNVNATSTAIYTKGCVTATKDLVKKNLIMIGGIGVGIAMVQLLGMIFSICLCRAIGYESI